jgi:hypothetical protein
MSRRHATYSRLFSTVVTECLQLHATWRREKKAASEGGVGVFDYFRVLTPIQKVRNIVARRRVTLVELLSQRLTEFGLAALLGFCFALLTPLRCLSSQRSSRRLGGCSST